MPRLADYRPSSSLPLRSMLEIGSCLTGRGLEWPYSTPPKPYHDFHSFLSTICSPASALLVSGRLGDGRAKPHHTKLWVQALQ